MSINLSTLNTINTSLVTNSNTLINYNNLINKPVFTSFDWINVNNRPNYFKTNWSSTYIEYLPTYFNVRYTYIQNKPNIFQTSWNNLYITDKPDEPDSFGFYNKHYTRWLYVANKPNITTSPWTINRPNPSYQEDNISYTNICRITKKLSIYPTDYWSGLNTSDVKWLIGEKYRLNIATLDYSSYTSTLPSSTGSGFSLTSGISGSYPSKDSTITTAVFNSSIWITDTIYIVSDKRIKTNIKNLNSSNSLNLINNIQPVSYNYIDFIDYGNKTNYGFIAQDIKNILPDAIKIEKKIIPNIFNVYNIENSNKILIDSNISNLNLHVNDKIKILFDKNSNIDSSITEISSNYIKINDNISTSNAFVYGTEVKDFLTLDKTYIYTLNVSATQELYKLIIQQKKEIIQLQNELLELQKTIFL